MQRATQIAAGEFSVAFACHRAIELTRAAFGNGPLFVPANTVARFFKGDGKRFSFSVGRKLS